MGNSRDDGAFVFTNLPGGKARLRATVQQPGNSIARIDEFELPAGQALKRDFSFVPGVEVSGEIKAKNLTQPLRVIAVEGETVRLPASTSGNFLTSEQAMRTLGACGTQPDEKFRLRSVPAGKVTLWVLSALNRSPYDEMVPLATKAVEVGREPVTGVVLEVP